MVREALRDGWRCLFANDFDPKKAASYVANWGAKELKIEDVGKLRLSDLPDRTPDLLWGSFPCQDLSLAGNGNGLKGDRSGAFWLLWERVRELVKAGRTPRMIVLENVVGTLTSHKGRDFDAIIGAFAEIKFDVGVMVIDAQYFVPQSRPRLFFVGVPTKDAPRQLSLLDEEVDFWHPEAVKRAYNSLPNDLQRRWIWWSMPVPSLRNQAFADLIEQEPEDVEWHTPAHTGRLLSMMSKRNQKKVEDAKAAGRRMVGGMYRRTRKEGGVSVQRLEVRFDDVAGCLRTPAGGSSRQLLLVVDGDSVRSRLISARETARLMGLPDTYELPDNYNDAYHLTGDGVVVHAVKYLAENLLEPHLRSLAALKQCERMKKKVPNSSKGASVLARDEKKKRSGATGKKRAAKNSAKDSARKKGAPKAKPKKRPANRRGSAAKSNKASSAKSLPLKKSKRGSQSAKQRRKAAA